MILFLWLLSLFDFCILDIYYIFLDKDISINLFLKFFNLVKFM